VRRKATFEVVIVGGLGIPQHDDAEALANSVVQSGHASQ